MFLSAEEINKCTRWLLASASPAVKYLTHKHILKTDSDSPMMRELWQDVAESDAALEIFSRQNEDGSWFSGGPWGPRGYRRQTGRGYTPSRPKFVTTAWILPYLGEMGYTAADERVRKACAFILREIHPHILPDSSSKAPNCCGLEAIPLRALASVGMGADERLQSEWAWLSVCQRTDGGWLNPNHLADSPTPSKTKGRWPWDRSCAWGSFFALQALYYAGDAVPRSALKAALAFLLRHLSQKDPQHIQTWVYHGHNIVKELLMFSEAGFDMDDPTLQTLLSWLKGCYRPDEGVFRTQERPISNFVRHISAIVTSYEQVHGADYWDAIAKTSAPVLRYHLYHLVEDDWLTYYATRMARNIISENTPE